MVGVSQNWVAQLVVLIAAALLTSLKSKKWMTKSKDAMNEHASILATTLAVHWFFTLVMVALLIFFALQLRDFLMIPGQVSRIDLLHFAFLAVVVSYAGKLAGKSMSPCTAVSPAPTLSSNSRGWA